MATSRTRKVVFNLSGKAPSSEIITIQPEARYFSLSLSRDEFPPVTVLLSGLHKLSCFQFSKKDKGREFRTKEFHFIRVSIENELIEKPLKITLKIW